MFDPEYELDPTYSNSLKETKVILVIFAVWATYTLTVAYQLGYPTPPKSESEPAAELSTFLGMPSWVFWSIVVPWLAANIVTGWFCFGYFSNDALDPEEALNEMTDLESEQASSAKVATDE